MFKFCNCQLLRFGARLTIQKKQPTSNIEILDNVCVKYLHILPGLGILRDMKNLGIKRKKRKKPGDVEDDFDSTEDGEASEKAHCASNQAQLGFHCHLYHV